MPPLTLTDDDKATIVGLLRHTIAADRFPHSPRIPRLRAILAKLEPPAPAAEPYRQVLPGALRTGRRW